MTSGTNISKEAVKRMKRTENQLNSQITKINHALAGNISRINNTVKKIEREQGQYREEFEPYYLRRRKSIEQIVESETAFPFIYELRQRANSMGTSNATRNSNQNLSKTHSKDSISSEGSQNRMSRDSSPSRKILSHKLGENVSNFRTSNQSLDGPLSHIYQASPRHSSRRMSLPMSFSLQSFQEHHSHNYHAPDPNHQQQEEGINVRLRRVQHELGQRKPKSRRQLQNSSLTSTEEREERKIKEIEARQHAIDEYIHSLDHCHYLRVKEEDNTQLSIQEIFEK